MRNPKRTDRAAAYSALYPVYCSAEKRVLFDTHHPEWCQTESWQKEAGRYAPRLADWVANEGYIGSPPKAEIPLEQLKGAEYLRRKIAMSERGEVLRKAQ
jgi:hypothetical protein